MKKRKGSCICIVLFTFFFIMLWGTRPAGASWLEDLFLPYTQKGVFNSYPSLKGEKPVTFRWWYKNRPYRLDLTLYESLYKFYAGQPKSVSYLDFKGPPRDWQEKFYALFTTVPGRENIFSVIARKIKKMGDRRSLSDDEIVELVITFIQSIPYDRENADRILKEEQSVKYPYEVLYKKRGTCSGKSFLGALILEDLGYGWAFFIYEERQHLALGLQVPDKYSNYDSGYCYVESTVFGLPPGIIPEFGEDSGVMPVQNYKFEKKDILDTGRDSGIFPEISTEKLGEVEIYQKHTGKEYTGIKEVMDKRNRIIQLYDSAAVDKNMIERLKGKVSRKEREITRYIKKMKQEKKRNNVDKYNNMVEIYREKHKNYREDLDRYNRLVKEYNRKIKKYNSLNWEFFQVGERRKLKD
ncbi:MAG: hypothetical protein ACQEQC_03810 [Elusimicrobiota bacterium]